MCDIFSLRFHQAAQGNHKAVSVEQFFRYLNKAVTIAANDCNTNQVFIETSHCAVYAWNSSCIDGTDIVHSVVAVGQEFKFPLDISLHALDISLHEAPTPVDGSVSAVHSFLLLAQENSVFATNILKLLTEERRSYHRERTNKSRNQQLFELGDLVMVRVAVQSQQAKDQVAKLTYWLWGPCKIVDVLEHGAYNLCKFGKMDGAKFRYHAKDISMLPPAICPVKPLNGPDLRYLNNAHAPIPHSLKVQWNVVFATSQLMQHHQSSSVMSSMLFLLVATKTQLVQPRFICQGGLQFQLWWPTSTSKSPFKLACRKASSNLVINCSLCPFSLKARYERAGISLELVQVKHCLLLRSMVAQSNLVFIMCIFSRHPADSNETDLLAWCWPEWHRYLMGDNGIIDYGVRVLFPPTRVPNADQFIAWADVVNLSAPTVWLLGPFDFM